jgi:hypothetical protein
LKLKLADEIVVWDTSSVPNGRYVIRVVASDAPSNSPQTALTGAMESTAFDIDNTPPVITVTNVNRQANRLAITFEVRDDNSAVQKAEYSLDGDRWQTIYPKDGIADSRLEQFELVLDGDTGSHGVIIRASDALNNVASARGDVVTPAATPPRRVKAGDYAVDEGDAIDVEGESGFGVTSVSTGRGVGASRTGAGAIEACADAFTVVRASTHTILTATGAPSIDCAGANRDCLTAFTTELMSSVCTAVSWRLTLARSEKRTS